MSDNNFVSWAWCSLWALADYYNVTKYYTVVIHNFYHVFHICSHTRMIHLVENLQLLLKSTSALQSSDSPEILMSNQCVYILPTNTPYIHRSAHPILPATSLNTVLHLHFQKFISSVKCNSELVTWRIHRVNVIFRPYGQKLSLKFRYFPSVRTEI